MTNQKSFVNLIDYRHDISLDMVVLNINKVNQKASPQGLAFFFNNRELEPIKNNLKVKISLSECIVMVK